VQSALLGWFSVADLGEGPRGPRPPLILGEKEEMTEGRKAGRASKTKLPPSPPINHFLKIYILYFQ